MIKFSLFLLVLILSSCKENNQLVNEADDLHQMKLMLQLNLIFYQLLLQMLFITTQLMFFLILKRMSKVSGLLII